MATELNKKVSRESTEEFDGRRINVNLNPDQTISLKLKGMKSGEVKINILELYQQLTGSEDTPEQTKGPLTVSNSSREKGSKKAVTIPLDVLRSMNAISTLDTPTLVKFDGLIKEVLDYIKTTESKY